MSANTPRDPARSRGRLDELLDGVLARLDESERAGPEDRARARAELIGAVERLAGEVDEARASAHERSVIERLRESLGSDVELSVRLPEAAQSSSSPSSELIERLAAQAPRESRYQIEGELARGGMGAILKVFDPDLCRSAAMKIALDSGEGSDARQRERIVRFLEEAQITGQLDHPGVVPVHDLGLDSQGRLYFTMRLVRGRDLGEIYDMARSGAEGWSQTRVLGVLLKSCEAIAYAHSKGVIHRDLKPANIMVGRFGEVYVMDWGLAKVLGRADSRDLRVNPDTGSSVRLESVRSAERVHDPSTPLVTMDGTVLGTPAYMSPEQARADVDRMEERSDVYAIGAMLYHLLAEVAPYQDSGRDLDARQLWLRILEGAPTPLAQLAPRAPPELVAICERAMAREIEGRYPSVFALAEDLRAFLENRVVTAYETGALAEFRKWVRRNRAVAASAALLLIGAFVASVAFALNEQRARLNQLLAADLFLADSLVAQSGQLMRADPAVRPLVAQWLSDAADLQSREALHVRDEPSPPPDAGGVHAAELSEVAKDRQPLAASAITPEAFRAREFQRNRDRLFGDRGLAQRMEHHGAWVGELEAASLTSAEAKSRWSDAIRSIADRNQCPQYEGLELAPQFGLLPLARNPASGLWEFAYLPTGEPPEEAVTDKMQESCALIMVLVPAGIAEVDPPVELAPFFLSKFEMTRAQWRRLTDDQPSTASVRRIRRPGVLPVETVSANDSEEVLSRAGLELPSDLQWDFAVFGPVSEGEPPAERREGIREVDGWPPNRRGFYGVDVNVSEWCRVAAAIDDPDAARRAYLVRGGDLLRPKQPTGTLARHVRQAGTGVRPMRSLQR